jgi:hypothetical protein
VRGDDAKEARFVGGLGLGEKSVDCRP